LAVAGVTRMSFLRVPAVVPVLRPSGTTGCRSTAVRVLHGSGHVLRVLPGVGGPGRAAWYPLRACPRPRRTGLRVPPDDLHGHPGGLAVAPVPVVRAAAVTAVVFALLAMGDRVTLHGVKTGIPGPYALICLAAGREPGHADPADPPHDPIIWIDHEHGPGRGCGGPRESPGQARGGVRSHTLAGRVGGHRDRRLLPRRPTPLTARIGRRPRVHHGRQLEAVRAGGQDHRASTADAELRARGHVVVGDTLQDFRDPPGILPRADPVRTTGRRSSAPRPPASSLLRQVADSGKVPVLSDQDRTNARAACCNWRAAIVVLSRDRARRRCGRRRSQLLRRRPRWSDGVWLWVSSECGVGDRSRTVTMATWTPSPPSTRPAPAEADRPAADAPALGPPPAAGTSPWPPATCWPPSTCAATCGSTRFGRVQKNNNNDQAFFEFVLAHGARVVFHGDNRSSRRR